MRGTVVVYKPGMVGAPAVTVVDGPPTLELLKEAIGGGHLEVVPYFDSFRHAGASLRCVAFCDEDGKGKRLPFNAVATELWDRVLRSTRGTGCAPDYLVGQIAVVYGDDEFMEAL
jgi:hypothetical protein